MKTKDRSSKTAHRTLDQIHAEFTLAEGLEFCDHADRVIARHRIPLAMQFRPLAMGNCQAVAVERDDAGFPTRALVWDGTTEVGSPWRIMDIDDAAEAAFLGIACEGEIRGAAGLASLAARATEIVHDEAAIAHDGL